MANRVFTPRKGGQELPDDVQDRPEQNRGYDDAVRGAERAKQQQDSEGAEGASSKTTKTRMSTKQKTATLSDKGEKSAPAAS